MTGRLLTLPALLFCVAHLPARADVPPLLDAAIGTWTTGQQDWSFVRRTKTLDSDGKLKDERVEAYDPSQPDETRWRLLEVNGKTPGPDDIAAENKKNARKRKYGSAPPGQLLDLPHASVKQEDAASVTYAVPVKRVAAGLVQTSNLVILIKVDRQKRVVERLTAQLRGTMRIALGLAKITDVDLDLSFDPKEKDATADTLPTGGTAHATLSVLGEHMEYDWSEFKVVPAHPST